jgi:GntR family transcriptional regulator, transcriptional repressor for pyruvate dehydrogenase complex
MLLCSAGAFLKEGRFLEPRKREPLASQIEEKLMNYISNHPVLIGEKIPNEFELAGLFGVSRSTIREAVKSLASKGILEVRRGAGTYVISTNRVEDDPLELSKIKDKYELAMDLCDVRLMLEPEIAMQASEHATEEDKQQLRKLCDEIEKMYNDGENHLQKDLEFHTYIARCSQNRVIEKLIPIIQSAIITFVDVTHRQLKDETIETHRAIVDAIERGDGVGAKYAMIMHLNYNRQMFIKLRDANRS